MANLELRKMLAEESPIPLEIIDEKMLLESFGLDSLEFMELLLRVQEKFGKEISDEAIANLETVGDLEEALAA